MVEKNAECGGALFSSERDGVTLEHGGVDHSTIVASTIPEELGLADHGLDYIDRTASAIHLFGDGVRIAIAETVDETVESIAAIDQADAEAWIELAELSTRLWELIGVLSDGRAVPMKAASRAGRTVLGRRARSVVDLATMPADELARRWFRSPHMRALAAFRSQFSGLPASHPGTGAVFCLTPSGHGRRYSRPRGGSRAFISAIESLITETGGAVETGFHTIAVERLTSGWAVRSDDGREVVARAALVSAIPPQDMILDLLAPDRVVPRKLRSRMEQVEVTTANLSQFTLAAALESRPSLVGVDGTGYEGAQVWMLSDPGAFLAHQEAAMAGRIADRPAVLATLPSVLDPATAPSGRASLWVNGFIARQLADGRTWADTSGEATTKVWATVDACLPGVSDSVTDSVFTSPDDLSHRTGALNPGFHLSATLGQSLAGRPVRGAANHRSGIDGLYLTGAGTNPGPSISGLPGRACADAVVSDLLPRGIVEKADARVRSAGRELDRARRLLAAVRRARRP